MATIKDIAAKAGVSEATVRRILRNDGKETWPSARERADRIRLIANELGYRPNWRARALRSGSTCTIGLLHENSMPFGSAHWQDIIHRLADRLHGRGYEMQYVPAGSPRSIQALLDRRFDGCLVMHKLLPQVREALEQANLPAVLINTNPVSGFASTRPDDQQGARLLGEYLLDQGHRRIAFMQPHGKRNHYSYQMRESMLKQTCLAAGVRKEDFKVIRGSVEEGFDDFFNLPVRPTAVVVFNDALATAFLHACWQRQVRVPEDVSVATFNNPPATAYTIPPLTVVDIPSQSLVDHAVKQLLEMVEQDQPDMYEPVVLPVTLKIRQSTGPADTGTR